MRIALIAILFTLTTGYTFPKEEVDNSCNAPSTFHPIEGGHMAELVGDCRVSPNDPAWVSCDYQREDKTAIYTYIFERTTCKGDWIHRATVTFYKEDVYLKDVQ